MPKKFTQEEFIAHAIAKHGEGRYDYSMVKYVNSATKVTLKCNKCGYIFEQTANGHIQGRGCPRCAGNLPLTTEEFIRRATEIHHGFYDYSKVKYAGNHVNVVITCPEHGDFEQTPVSHLKGCGCWKCYNKRTSKRLFYGKEKFIELARKKHGDKYDYSLVEYVDSYTKVKIICPIHGLFEQRPSEHLLGKGCEKCAIEHRTKLRTKDTKWFIARAREIHGDKYTYEHSVYTNSKHPIIITCPIHGDWETTPNTFLDNHGCPYCKGDAERERMKNGKAKTIAPDQTKTTEEFIEDAIRLHGDKYRYDKVNYINSKEKVIITCPEHGDFETTPNEHLAGRGCPKCHQSFGEHRVGLFLERHHIQHKPQKKLYYTDEYGEKHYFQVDFYIPSGNIIIEYNGEQHYMPVKSWRGEKGYKDQLKRDATLRKYCKEHGYRLIEISYKKLRHIDEILEKELKPKNDM